jgi:ABC-type uncharacterized transport system fused permease/ATPase subunit
MDKMGGKVDADTDALIHEVLQKEIEACNVIAVVHNFNLEVAVEFLHELNGQTGSSRIKALPPGPLRC